MEYDILAVWFIGDLYVHADLHGASSIVIKNPSSSFSQLTSCSMLFFLSARFCNFYHDTYIASCIGDGEI